jgi:acyl dehydratase
MNVGDSISVKRIFTQDDYDRFARLSGDDNPIHVDPVFAARTRFGRTLAHGMLLFSTLSAAVHELFAEGGAELVEQELMFPGPTFTGEEMTIRLEVLAISARGERAEVGVTITRPDGSASLVGKSVVERRRS